MTALIPQNLTHRGAVSAEAFLLSAKILSEAEMRCRVLKLWEEGVRLFRRDDDLIVILPRARHTDAGRSPGLPFVRYGKILSAFPLKKKDLEDFRDFSESLLFLDNGNIEIVSLQSLSAERIETWFEISDLFVVETVTLGETVQSVPCVMKAITEDDVNLRAELGAVPQADSQIAEILEKLKELKKASENKKAEPVFSGSYGADSGGGLTSFFSSIFKGLKDFLVSGGTSFGSSGGYTKPGAGGSGNYDQPEPGVFSKLYNKLRHLSVKAIVEMRLARIFGRQQAKYLAEMMEKFERGDITEALKYAIPLEDMQALQSFMQKTPALFAPRPRTDLQISFGQKSSGSTYDFGAEWFEHLRQLYRQTFERLQAQGRIEEAAFVLAELLKSNAEAVEFLSRHGKYRLAAELAEARNLPKETIVRQWFLAGEKMRAVRLAILHNCFEYAVAKFEQENSVFGAELREIWAESLAQSGNYPAAVDVLWKLEDKRARAKDWMEKSIEFGGTAGARMLARKAMLFPEDFDEIKAKFQEILRGEESEAIEQRAAFARAVFKQSLNDEVRTLLRPLTRRIISDASHKTQSLSLAEFRELAVLTKDNALRADLPSFPQIVLPLAMSGCLEITIEANDKGASVIYDACVLPDGKIVIALGESGFKILSRYGKSIAYFDQPAQKLVVSDFSNKAIALAARGETTRLSKIDFVERRASFWCDASISVFAPNFDGNLWFIGSRDEFYAIDTSTENFDAIWSVPDVGGVVHAAVRSSAQVKFLTLSSTGFETWWYELPSLTLRSRNQRKWLENVGENFLYNANISEGGLSVVVMQEVKEESKDISFYANLFDHEYLSRKFDFPAGTKSLSRAEIYSQYTAIVSYAENYAKVYVFFAGGNLIADFTLVSTQNASIKFIENYLVISDDCGRLLVYDFKNRSLRQNIRV